MRLRKLALRLGLFAAATGGIAAACYNELPGPSGPLPPTREVGPLGPKPGPLTPTPVRIDTDAGLPVPSVPNRSASRVIETQTRIGAAPAHDMHDAGIPDVIDLPPVPDADITIDAPVDRKSAD